MSSKVFLKDVCTRICSGGTPKRSVEEYYKNGKIPWLNTSEIKFNRIRKTTNFITDTGLENSSAKWIEPNSVVVAMYGATAGKVAISKIPLTTNQACCNLEIDPSIADYRYIYYWLKSRNDLLTNLTNGGAQQNLNAQIIKNLEINLPNIGIQARIANHLSLLDDKIELNNQINDYLLELATVRFEQALISESDTFRFSELVELEDSKREPLNSRDRETRKGIYPYYGATSIMDYIDDYLFDGIRVLVGEDGTVIQEDGKPVLQYVWGKYWVNNHAHVLRSKSDYSLEAIYIALARTAISHIVTGAVQMKISQKNLNNLELEMPQPSSLRYLEDIFTLYRKSTEESKMLERLRDLLLPRLMSGEIDVSKIDITQLNNHLSDC